MVCQAQVKTKSTTISRIIAKDSLRLGGVWRSTWPVGGGSVVDSTGVWSLYANTVSRTPAFGTKNNYPVNMYSNNKLLLQINTDSTVKVKSRIPANDSTEQVSSTAWIKKNIERFFVFDSTITATDLSDKITKLHVNTDNMATVQYVDNAINNIIAFDGWATNGNLGTDATQDFVGTKDAQPLVIKTNNQEVARFTGDGKFNFLIGAASSSITSTGNHNYIIGASNTITANSSYNFINGAGINIVGGSGGNFAAGTGHTVNATSSAVFGNSNTVALGYSFTAGAGNKNTAGISIAAGQGLYAKSYTGAVFGQYNDSTNAASESTTDPLNRLFQIGNGTANNSRSNAVTVLQNGNTGIGTTTPDSTLTVAGGLRFDLPTKGIGKILTSDANGSATWQAAPLLTSGTYTPVVNISANLDTVYISTCSYSRNGDKVEMTGEITVRPSIGSGAISKALISLPPTLISNFTATSQCGGTAAAAIATTTNLTAGFFANPVADQIEFYFPANYMGKITYNFHLSYQIL